MADVIQACSLEVLEEEEEHGGHRLHDDLLVTVHVDALMTSVCLARDSLTDKITILK